MSLKNEQNIKINKLNKKKKLTTLSPIISRFNRTGEE